MNFLRTWFAVLIIWISIIDIALAGDVVPSINYYFKPITQFSIRNYNYGSDFSNTKYCLENSEGDCLDKRVNFFTEWGGEGGIGKRLSLLYRAQLQDVDRFRFKQASLRLRTGIVSWKVGKDTVWLGHGYHGSLLLSTNAEGFLLFHFKTEDPFRLPWVLSKAGEFKYELFHGWLEDFNLLGHRLSWSPVPLIEFGFNQTVTYAKDRGYQLIEYPRVHFSSTENLGGQFDNDQRGSLDLALYMPFLSKLPPLKEGKFYAEYAGEDSYAWWQEEDGKWVWPIGFDYLHTAYMLGLFLTTGQTDFRVEYAQNHRNKPLFTHINGIDLGGGGSPAWYSKIPFVNDRVFLGHHMGSQADDLFFQMEHRWLPFSIKYFYDIERHGMFNYPNSPEIRQQFGTTLSYRYMKTDVSANFLINRFKNVDFNPNPLGFDIREGTDRREYVIGFGIEWNM